MDFDCYNPRIVGDVDLVRVALEHSRKDGDSEVIESLSRILHMLQVQGMMQRKSRRTANRILESLYVTSRS
jgi:hypothetical protein